LKYVQMPKLMNQPPPIESILLRWFLHEQLEKGTFIILFYSVKFVTLPFSVSTITFSESFITFAPETSEVSCSSVFSNYHILRRVYCCSDLLCFPTVYYQMLVQVELSNNNWKITFLSENYPDLYKKSAVQYRTVKFLIRSLKYYHLRLHLSNLEEVSFSALSIGRLWIKIWLIIINVTALSNLTELFFGKI
jgi:hypothetical protein